MSILEDICARKHEEVEVQKALISENTLIAHIAASRDEPRGFMNALRDMMSLGKPAVIAEIKKASPSAGIIREDFHPIDIAQQYASNDAACLSVLTDEHYFQGNALYLRDVRDAVSLPLLRKDFMVDRYQIVESRALGADCILLIAAALTDAQMAEFTRVAHDLGMDVLVEVHNEQEFDRALQLPVHAIGVNNRNLHDFSVDLSTSTTLQQKLPEDYFLISESGIDSHADIVSLQNAGINAFLVGGSLMKAENPGLALKQLICG